jgi:hypothetical protein
MIFGEGTAANKIIHDKESFVHRHYREQGSAARLRRTLP